MHGLDQRDWETLHTLKRKVLRGEEFEVSSEYQEIIREWKESVQLGVPFDRDKLTSQHRDMHVFERIDELQKCHIQYFGDYYKNRTDTLDELGCAVFYLDTQLAAYHKAGNMALLKELKQKGIRIGTQFSPANVGVFVANMALQSPFENFCRVGNENYLTLFQNYACLARYGAGDGTGFFSVNLLIAPLERYDHNLYQTLCFILEAEDVAYKNNFIYPHIERRIKLLEKSAQFSNDIFLLVDEQGDVAFYNDRFEDEFRPEGRSSLGRPLKELLPPLACVLHSLNDGQEISAHEVVLPNAQRERQSYYVDCIVIRDNHRNIGLKLSLKTNAQMKRYTARFNKQVAHFTFDDIKGESTALAMCKKMGCQAAGSVSNVLITGESGTGKELFAQAIHNASSRRGAPFVPVNCGAIPKELIGSELFGYEDGAFTGARRGGQTGKFEQADKGTIFLDEIAEMPLDMQVYLLRFLEEGVLSRIGGKKYIPLDIRIIAATNKNLWECVGNSTFRLDLYFRLNVLRLELPPLRERLDDMDLLIHHFIGDLSQKLGKYVRKVTPEVVDLFQQYDWPGNLRELRNTVERCVNILPDGVDTLDVGAIPPDLCRIFSLPTGSVLRRPGQTGSIPLVHDELPNYKEYEAGRLKLLMLQHRGNKSIVAKELGISRSTLYKRLRDLGYDL